MNARKILVTALLAALLSLLGISVVSAQDDALLIWADGERAPLLTELGAQFEEEFGIPVEVQQMGLGDARDQLLIAGPVGEGPDILITAHDTIGQFVTNGAIVPLDLGDIAEDFYPNALNLFTYQGQLWGVPYATENVALIRNVDLVPEAPATWEEVRAIGEELQASGAAEFGFLVQSGNTYHNFPITSGFGGYIFGRNEDGTFNVADIGLASEGGLAAAEWLAGMYADGLMVPDVSDDVAFELFAAGDAAMIVTGPWFSKRITDTGVNYSIDPLPTSEAIAAEGGAGTPFFGGQGFVISAFSDKQLQAEAFLLDFVATTDFMQAIYDQGGRPSAMMGVDTSTDPNVDAFNAAGTNAIPMPAIPEMGAVWGASDQALTAISLGEDPVVAMNSAAEQVVTAIGLMSSEERIVVLVGSLQDDANADCAEWTPDCRGTEMTDEDGDGVYTVTYTLPAGDYEYKVAINLSWAENYGVDGAADGGNILLSLAEETEVTFTFDGATNTVTDSVNHPM